MLIDEINVQVIIIAVIHLIGVRWGIWKTPYLATVTWQATIILLTSFSYYAVFVQLINDLVSTTSTAIGINEWFAPQISEHWP